MKLSTIALLKVHGHRWVEKARDTVATHHDEYPEKGFLWRSYQIRYATEKDLQDIYYCQNNSGSATQYNFDDHALMLMVRESQRTYADGYGFYVLESARPNGPKGIFATLCLEKVSERTPSYSRCFTEAEIKCIRVSKDVQNTGLGSALMRVALVRFFQNHPNQSVFFTTNPANNGMASLANNFGFDKLTSADERPLLYSVNKYPPLTYGSRKTPYQETAYAVDLARFTTSLEATRSASMMKAMDFTSESPCQKARFMYIHVEHSASANDPYGVVHVEEIGTPSEHLFREHESMKAMYTQLKGSEGYQDEDSQDHAQVLKLLEPVVSNGFMPTGNKGYKLDITSTIGMSAEAAECEYKVNREIRRLKEYSQDKTLSKDKFYSCDVFVNPYLNSSSSDESSDA